jgi:C1A family cysteine protease
MKAIALLLCAVIAVSALQEENYQFLFSKFVSQYNKKYESEHFLMRYNVFKRNMDTVLEWNARTNETSTMGMNEWSDLTSEEWKGMSNGYRARPHTSTLIRPAKKVVGDISPVDWRQKGAVTPVKNQGQCGSCWAFSTTGSVEGAWVVAGNPLVSLSEQQLVDCAGSAGNQGCNGGLMDNAFNWIIQNGGICSESDYPYSGEDGSCQTSCKPAATISSFVDVTSGDENALLQALLVSGPVSIAIEADQSVFQMYQGGIITSPACGTNLDHGVLIVGSGTEGTQDYWLVKNSWGASWGENGYVRLAYGTNECGLSTVPSFPVAP